MSFLALFIDCLTAAMQWDTITYTASNGAITSYPATITLVPPSGALMGSDFLLSNEDWSIVGNKAVSTAAQYESYNRGGALNHYVLGTDDTINIQSTPQQTKTDTSLWYFVAPSKFHGNWGISYGGTLSFTLGRFSGDFRSLNAMEVCLLPMRCACMTVWFGRRRWSCWSVLRVSVR